ncbi:tail sheath stabilizer [Synechococcus phage S-CRM01]|uniref:tail sheath stabilizer n=1 Tax=Synechococcus phage S-CRM01 TaxID=1026955 RepID=UPI000209E349|nr:tail sheath stabilizer [Synechococcus phage S-CRM01]AEC52978.1 tail sheath stabilizer [Synechococcus phage S-CRM01]
MLGGRYYYHQILRKSIIAFATLFNNIVVKRRAVPGVSNNETIETYKVPIQYGPYEKWLAIIAAKAKDVKPSTQITLPRISFQIKGMTYDGSRKVVPTQYMRSVPSETTTSNNQPVQFKQYMPVPYNLEVELSVLTKTQDDGLQIIEQILPNFHPSLNVSIEVIDETHEERDIAIILNGISYIDDYEGDYTQRGTTIWTLNFTVKTYLFGPVDVEKDIRKVVLDYRTDIVNRPAELRYSAEVASTDVPPIPRNEIDPTTDNYTVVETYEDVFSSDNDFFGLTP